MKPRSAQLAAGRGKLPSKTTNVYLQLCMWSRKPSEAEERGASGILLSLEELQSLEERIAAIVLEFASMPEALRNGWVAERLGGRYPRDLAATEVAADLVSREVNATGFSSTFRCPACGRIAVATPPKRAKWSFFTPE